MGNAILRLGVLVELVLGTEKNVDLAWTIGTPVSVSQLPQYKRRQLADVDTEGTPLNYFFLKKERKRRAIRAKS